MKNQSFNPTRRNFVHGLAFGTAFVSTSGLFTTPGLFAEELTKTPSQTEGPFFPNRLPLDTDNDLLILNDSITPAVGEITHLTGKVLEPNGKPLRNATVEVWQVDAKGVYIHTSCPGQEKRDKNFQGFGRFLTNSKGEYYFRTIKPVEYPGRTPHIHLAVSRGGKRILTTQMYIRGDKRNQRDGILQNIHDNDARNSLIIDFKKIEGSKIGELSANFDMVVGVTPDEGKSN